MTFQGSFQCHYSQCYGESRTKREKGNKGNIVQGGSHPLAKCFLKDAPGQMHTFQLSQKEEIIVWGYKNVTALEGRLFSILFAWVVINCEIREQAWGLTVDELLPAKVLKEEISSFIASHIS